MPFKIKPNGTVVSWYLHIQLTHQRSMFALSASDTRISRAVSKNRLLIRWYQCCPIKTKHPHLFLLTHTNDYQYRVVAKPIYWTVTLFLVVLV